MTTQFELVQRKARPACFITLLDATIKLASTYVDSVAGIDWSRYIGVLRKSEPRSYYYYVTKGGELVRRKAAFSLEERAVWRRVRRAIYRARTEICNAFESEQVGALTGRIIYRSGMQSLESDARGVLYSQFRPAFSSGFVRGEDGLGLVLIDSRKFENLLASMASSATVAKTESHELVSRGLEYQAAIKLRFAKEYGKVETWPYFKKDYLQKYVHAVLVDGLTTDGEYDQAWRGRNVRLLKKELNSYISTVVPAECFSNLVGVKDSARILLGEQFLEKQGVELGLK